MTSTFKCIDGVIIGGLPPPGCEWKILGNWPQTHNPDSDILPETDQVAPGSLHQNQRPSQVEATLVDCNPRIEALVGESPLNS